ncbi:unnamed protein product [Diabrotica balteata]|uniref:Uncharacterized protein n=1 Tax=Diabrotica balteata TaxID=107213 RepID=A0A9N9XFH6_DIABA|nr:unnamed protein product [Diabrotica balteata]
MEDYFINDLRLIEQLNDHRNQRNNIHLRHIKIYKIRKNPLEELEENEFKCKYRFSKATAVFIIDMLRDDLSGDSRGGHIPPHLKVLSAIRTWARGEF